MKKTVAATTKSKKHFCWFKLLTICVVLFALLKLGQQYQRYQAIQSEVELHQQQFVTAQDEYQRLQDQMKLYYSDSYLEQIARSSLGMVKQGEVVVSPAEVGDVPELNKQLKDKDVLH